MAEHHQQLQVHPQQAVNGLKKILPEKGPSSSQVLTVVTLFPVGGILLVLAGLTLTGTLIGLAVTTPLFIIFSPILVPAGLVIALSVTGFLTSGAFGLTALSSLTWIANYLREGRGALPEHMEHAKRRLQDTTAHVGQRTKDVGQGLQSKAHEGGRT